MDGPFLKRIINRVRRAPLWAWEVSIFAAMAPPLLHAVATLDRLPLA